MDTGTVARRADANFAVHATWIHQRTAGMRYDLGPGLVLADSGLRCDTFNLVCCARLDEPGAPEAARAAIAWFEGRPFSWWLGPADRPARLGIVLEAVGLERAEAELAMALPLDRLPEAPAPVPGLEVRRVRSAVDLEAVARVAAANWTPPDVDVIDFYRSAGPVLLEPGAPLWFYLGLLDGEPVATAEATVQDGTVGLYNIAARAEFRGRGIGSMLSWLPLRDAWTEGCDLAVLQASADGARIYRRFGFAPFGGIVEYKPVRTRS